jgi:hypothetical protein
MGLTKFPIQLHWAGIVLVWAAAGGSLASAQTYVSAEPIPSQEIVGAANLAQIEGVGYANLARWSNRLLYDCHIVQNVIGVLWLNQAITTVNPGNTVFKVAAGGFQAVTDPTYVLTMADSGQYGASASDIFVLDNALGYALNQGGTAQFSPTYNSQNPFEFELDYAVVSHNGPLSGEQAEAFFNYLGTIDPALWSGTDAGFTQINFSSAPVRNFLLDDSMLFLIGAVTDQEFEQGLYKAAVTSPGMTYFPLAKNGQPETAQAGAAFPGNDWVSFPNGDQYLVNLPASPQLLKELAGLRQEHLEAVANLLNAINQGTVEKYLDHQFRCP